MKTVQGKIWVPNPYGCRAMLGRPIIDPSPIMLTSDAIKGLRLIGSAGVNLNPTFKKFHVKKDAADKAEKEAMDRAIQELRDEGLLD